MIRHCVLWTFHKTANGCSKDENLQKARKLLMDMKGRIPGLLHIDCGINVYIDNASWDLALFTEFDSIEDLKVYQTHPVHEEVKRFMALVRDQRAVVDWEVNQ